MKTGGFGFLRPRSPWFLSHPADASSPPEATGKISWSSRRAPRRRERRPGEFDLTADGASFEVTVDVTDAFGNPVADGTVVTMT